MLIIISEPYKVILLAYHEVMKLNFLWGYIFGRGDIELEFKVRVVRERYHLQAISGPTVNIINVSEVDSQLDEFGNIFLLIEATVIKDHRFTRVI